MGKKKNKEPQETPQSDALSAPSSIFNSLFGNAPEQSTATAASLFSNDNPFRRKSQPPAPVSDVINHTPNPENGVVEEEKKRKRNKEKSPVLESDSAIKASEKKKKKKDSSKGEEKEINLGTEVVVKDVEEGEKNKKKRKREELEKEWEEKKYGKVEGYEREGLGNEKVGEKRKLRVNPADMMVSKEGFDDEDKLLRTIFVGNLPIKVKKKTLLKEFKKFGEIESVRIRSVPIQDTKKPRKGAILAKKINEQADSVNAYIVFKTEESAQASLSQNMTVVDGYHIRVDRACPPRKKLKGESNPRYDNKRTVFVGNLPFDVKDEEIYQLFCGIPNLESSIEAVRVVRDPHLSLGKGIAYVLFKTKEAAHSVAKKRNLKLRDRELRLSHAKADATPSKRSHSPSAKFGKADATPSKRPHTTPTNHPSTPAKKFSGDSRSPSSSNNKSNRITSTSYQGLRATKSDVHKKSRGAEKPKDRVQKRPTVAARKAKAKLVKEGDTPKQAGFKRKFDSRTPDSSVGVRNAKKKR